MAAEALASAKVADLQPLIEKKFEVTARKQ
jgi:hypothetical protein